MGTQARIIMLTFKIHCERFMDGDDLGKKSDIVLREDILKFENDRILGKHFRFDYELN